MNKQSRKTKKIAKSRKTSSSSSDGRVTSMPVAFSASYVGKIPKMQADARSCRISHREFLGNTTPPATNSFTVQTIPLNPGISTSFPWLSSIANNYEMYRFRKLAFEYRTRIKTSEMGSVTMAFDYDATDPAPTTEITMANYADAINEVAWIPVLRMEVPQARLAATPYNLRYTRAGSYLDIDKKLYDLGNLYLGFTNYSTAYSEGFGKLIVEYEVELFVPQIRVIEALGGFQKNSTTLGTTNPFKGAVQVSNPAMSRHDEVSGTVEVSRFTADTNIDSMMHIDVLRDSGVATGDATDILHTALITGPGNSVSPTLTPISKSLIPSVDSETSKTFYSALYRLKMTAGDMLDLWYTDPYDTLKSLMSLSPTSQYSSAYTALGEYGGITTPASVKRAATSSSTSS